MYILSEGNINHLWYPGNFIMREGEKERILLELGGIAEDVYDSLVRDFKTQSLEQIKQARAAASAGDCAGGAEIMHSIKGCAANLRLYAALSAAREAETAFRLESPADNLLPRLDALHAAVISAG